MNKLRSAVAVIAWIGIAVSTLFWTLVIGAVYLIHRVFDPQLRLAHRLASWWGRGLILMAPGTKVKVHGRRNIPHNRPVIFMANHQSFVDIPALFFLPGQFKWMADEGLFGIPVFGWAMKMAGYVAVQRGNAKEGVKALRRAKKLLEQGISIFIFPEGTRSHSGMLGRFQSGGFRLAEETKAPIVPVMVSGTRQLLPRGEWAFRIGVRIWIDVLPPVPASGHRGEIRPSMEKVRRLMYAAQKKRLKDLRPGARRARIADHAAS